MPATRSPRWAWTVAWVIVGIAIVRWPPTTTPFGADDYGQYLMHAQALTEGRSYGDIDYLYSPYAPFTGPPLMAPGLPIVLIPFVAANIASLPLLRMGMLLTLLLVLALAARYFGRRNPLLGPAVVAVCGTAYASGTAITTPNPDMILTALMWLIVFMVDRDDRWDLRKSVAVTLLGCAALLVRPAAVPLIPALGAVWLLRARQYRWWPSMTIGIWGAVAWWLYGVSGIGRFPPAPSDLTHNSMTLMETVLRNGVMYAKAGAEVTLYPFPVNWANDGYHLIAAPLVAFGILWWSWQERRSLAPWLFAAYASMLLLVGVVDGRYLWPAYPVIAAGFAIGLWQAVLALNRRRPRYAAAITASLLVVIPIGASLVDYGQRDRVPVEDPAVRAMDSWVRGYAAERSETRVAAARPRTLAWRAGVKSAPLVMLPPSQTADELGRLGVTLVLIGDPDGNQSMTRHWRLLVASHPDWFEPMWSNALFAAYSFSPR